MKDPTDPGTLDMHPAKRGRPCKDPASGPLDAAQRARLYRERRQVVSSRMAYGRERDLRADDLTTVRILDAIGRLSGDIDRNPAAAGVPARRKRLQGLLKTLQHRYG